VEAEVEGLIHPAQAETYATAAIIQVNEWALPGVCVATITDHQRLPNGTARGIYRPAWLGVVKLPRSVPCGGS